jgi:hypothetical protein
VSLAGGHKLNKNVTYHEIDGFFMAVWRAQRARRGKMGDTEEAVMLRAIGDCNCAACVRCTSRAFVINYYERAVQQLPFLPGADAEPLRLRPLGATVLSHPNVSLAQLRSLLRCIEPRDKQQVADEQLAQRAAATHIDRFSMPNPGFLIAPVVHEEKTKEKSKPKAKAAQKKSKKKKAKVAKSKKRRRRQRRY